MQFGFTLKPEHSIERTIALTRQAEAAGFEYGWLFDSHVLWRDPYPLLTLMAQATTTMRLGTCVTNPATREPTVTASALAVLDELSGGRMDLGIGRGDSARRVLGKAPTVDEGPRAGGPRDPRAGRGPRHRVRGHDAGAALDVRAPAAACGSPATGRWRSSSPGGSRTARCSRSATRTSSAGSSRRCATPPRRPAATRTTSRSWPRRRRTSATSRTAATGRAGSRRSWATTSWTSSTSTRARTCREELTAYVRDREGYDYLHHAEVGSSNASFVTDEIVDRFCLVGEPEQHIARLRDPGRGRGQPVQPLPDERERGGAGGAVREAHHPGAPGRGAGPGLTVRRSTRASLPVDLLVAALALVGGYLVGSIPLSAMIGRAAGVDVGPRAAAPTRAPPTSGGWPGRAGGCWR